MNTPFALVLCLAGSAAQAGVVLDTTVRDGAGNEVAVSTLQVDNGMARVEKVDAGQQAANGAAIFKNDRVYVLNHAKKTYLDVDRDSLQKAAGGMDKTLKQMEAQFSSMSPERRAMIEKMMGRNAAVVQKGGKAPIELTRTVRTEQVGSYSCQIWEGKREGVKLVEHCVVPYAKVTGGTQLAEALGNLSDAAQATCSWH